LPYIEKARRRFEADGFVVLAVNLAPEEDPMVTPFLAGNGYRFIALRGDQGWASRVYRVSGAPSSFLIDKNGRVVYKPRIDSPQSARQLETEIESLVRQRDR
jgi:hypothetical protein